MSNIKIFLGAFSALLLAVTFTADAQDKNPNNKSSLEADNNAPTYISADRLFVDNLKREFTYTGNVRVKRGKMDLTAHHMKGSYDDKNQIDRLTASGDVFITSSENIKASSQEANYDAKGDILTLTKSPELEQDGSILTADVIKIFVQEDRSEAEGDVRLRMPEDKK